MSIKNNIRIIAGELPANCRLIAVSKTHTAETILEAYQAGHRVFGENKVQEMVAKWEVLPKDIEWHLIGHLQSNKVKYIAPFVSLIHSVDSMKLLQEINKQAGKAGRQVACLLQVFIATEETKFGLDERELFELLNEPQLKELAFVKVVGLMGMASFTDNQEQVRKEFKFLRALFERIKQMELPPNVAMQELSMGMSADYKVAIQEGSTLVRVGTAIFGHRDYSKSH